MVDDDLEKWLKALESIGPGAVEALLGHSSIDTFLNIKVGKDEEAVQVPPWFAINWLGKKRDKERAEQDAREERMIAATSGARWAAWGAAIAALASAAGAIVQAWGVMRTLLIALAVMASFGAAAQERQALLCVETARTGFHFEKGSGQPARFEEERFSAIRDGSVLMVKERDVDKRFECSPTYRNDPNILTCSDGSTQTILLHLKSFRFSRSLLSGHVVGAGTDDLGIAYGTCQRF